MDIEVVVVGSINADLVVEVARHPHPGETVLGRAATVLPGGKGANQAVAAARLGGRVAMVGAVGDDAYADLAIEGLAEAGVDLTYVARHPGSTGLALVTVSDDGENSIVVIPGANEVVTPDVVASVPIVGQARVCVLQIEVPLATVVRAAEIASAAGARVVLNAAPATSIPGTTLAVADPLVVNEHEASIVLGHDPGSPHAAVTGLLAAGARSVVLTLGGSGVIGQDADGAWSLPAREVAVRDTTGAGDAFVGALALGLAQGQTLREAALTATRVAAASVSRLGAQASYPWQGDPLP